MLELQKILDQPESLAEVLKQRSWDSLDITKLQELIKKNKELIRELQEKQAERNRLSKGIGSLLSKGKASQAEKQKKW